MHLYVAKVEFKEVNRFSFHGSNKDVIAVFLT